MMLLLSAITIENRIHLLKEQWYSMIFNLIQDRNCQFSALAYAFGKSRIFRSPTTFRYEVVKYLRNNLHNTKGLGKLFTRNESSWNI